MSAGNVFRNCSTAINSCSSSTVVNSLVHWLVRSRILVASCLYVSLGYFLDSMKLPPVCIAIDNIPFHYSFLHFVVFNAILFPVNMKCLPPSLLLASLCPRPGSSFLVEVETFRFCSSVPLLGFGHWGQEIQKNGGE